MKGASSTETMQREARAGYFRQVAHRVLQSRYRGEIYKMDSPRFTDFCSAFQPYRGLLSDMSCHLQATMLCMYAAMVEAGDA